MPLSNQPRTSYSPNVIATPLKSAGQVRISSRRSNLAAQIGDCFASLAMTVGKASQPSRRTRTMLGFLCAIFLLAACAPGRAPALFAQPFASALSPVPTPAVHATRVQGIPVFTFRVVNTYPHDPTAFTEGLALDHGVLFEGTGLNGRSELRRVDLESGQVVQSLKLDPQYFGEGVTTWGDRIIQLTWKTRLGFVYDKTSFALLKTFEYPTEGWGLTHDDTQLIMSDGTAIVRFLDPNTFQETKRITVTADGGPVFNLNELEYVRGEIWANVWQTDRIARIAPDTGQVIGWIDLTGLLGPADRQQPVDVLNGIAYDAEHDRLFVTGKLWPKLFEITLVPRP